MSTKDLPYWLAIHRLPNIGPARFAELLQIVNSLSNCFNGESPTAELIDWCQRRKIPLELDWPGVEKDLKFSQKPDAFILTWQDERYPALLKQIPGSPPVIFVLGRVDALKLPQIAIVGSRIPTQDGKQNAYQFGYELALQGFTITSGLALGIDAASHEGALAAGGLTIGVQGNSLDQIYPATNRTLAKKIKANGAIVSEFPMGTEPAPKHFPRRNRIISGLSLGVVVIESALKSGSLISANYALEQGREVFALPGSIHNPMAKGCNQLIRQGAKCVETITHIMEELPLADLERPLVPLVRNTSAPSLMGAKEKLLSYLGNTCTPIDVIIDKSGLTLEEVSSMLLELELQEKISAIPGGYIRIGVGA
ncbi:MAG: DNA-processing protein DprA [Candidatus Berkiellales bacterium]